MSKDAVISANNIGKRYRIGHLQRYKTLRDNLSSAFRWPLRCAKRTFGIAEESQNGATEDFWALDDVNFEIKKGEAVGLIGRNGAGKSTLLKVLSRITEPTTGHIEIEGRVGSLLEVGTGFHPELTGRENIFLNGAILGMRRVEITQKFDEIVQFAEIERFLDTPVKHYSSGMYTRLAFSVAAHLEPEILLVDEVLAVGDIAFQKKCLGKMGSVSMEGRTVIFVSHSLQAIRSLCQRSILLEGGKVRAVGATSDVLDQYVESLQETSALNSSDLKRSASSRRGSGAARFSGISVEDGEGTVRWEFCKGETLRLSFEYHIEEELSDLYISVAFCAQETQECVTQVRERVASGKTGSGSAVLEFPDVNLRPRDYGLRFYLMAKDTTLYDAIDEFSPHISIRTDRNHEELGYDPSKPTGYFDLPVKLISTDRE